MASAEPQSVRRVSKALFRKEHRLAVALAALEAHPDRLYAQAIADDLDLPQREVSLHLRDFEQAGLLQRKGSRAPNRKGPGRPGILYSRSEDDFWTYVASLKARFRSS